MEEQMVKTPSEHSSLVGLNDAADEFFDVSEPLDYDPSENGWSSDFGPESYSQVLAIILDSSDAIHIVSSKVLFFCLQERRDNFFEMRLHVCFVDVQN